MADFRETIPGWKEAVKAEKEAHELAFVYPHDNIAGVAVRHATLADLFILEKIGNRFACGNFPSWHEFSLIPECRYQAYELLCFLSLDQSKNAFVNFLRRLRYRFLPKEELYVGLSRYFLDTYMDHMATPVNSRKPVISYWADCVAYIDLLALEYGWSECEIMAMPYRKIIQIVRKISNRKNPDVPLASKADKVATAWLFEQDQKRKAVE